MPSLREVQEAFLRGALHGDVDAIAGLIREDAIPARECIAIYANNARENFVGTLAAAFPVVRALGGDDWFRQTAQAYWRRHPSRAGNLHRVGEQFATFLQQQLGTTEYAYFADVAALEWSYQEALVAADHPGFDLAALGTVPPEHYGALCFTLHPSARMISSAYPILDLWRAHRPGACESEPVDLAAGAQWLVLIRLADHVQLRAIDRAAWVLLQALSTGATLGAAAERALALSAQFDLTSALAQFIGLGVLVDFSTQLDP